MSVRIFIKHMVRSNGDVYYSTHSVVIESDELEASLNGGIGGGCDGDDFTIPEIIGFERVHADGGNDGKS